MYNLATAKISGREKEKEKVKFILTTNIYALAYGLKS